MQANCFHMILLALETLESQGDLFLVQGKPLLGSSHHKMDFNKQIQITKKWEDKFI